VSVSISPWRIAVDASQYTADELTGAGAKATGGRWNRKGRAVLYTSTSVALACLETVVHSKLGSLPMNRFLVRIDLPLDAWMARDEHTARSLPVGWDALPEGRVSLDLGDAWLAAGQSPVMVVPSAIVPEERNVLINPDHPLCRSMKARKLRKWLYDPRLFGLHA
jgi:RES domain-containing protein